MQKSSINGGEIVAISHMLQSLLYQLCVLVIHRQPIQLELLVIAYGSKRAVEIVRLDVVSCHSFLN